MAVTSGAILVVSFVAAATFGHIFTEPLGEIQDCSTSFSTTVESGQQSQGVEACSRLNANR
jgi:hypothetical protein